VVGAITPTLIGSALTVATASVGASVAAGVAGMSAHALIMLAIRMKSTTTLNNLVFMLSSHFFLIIELLLRKTKKKEYVLESGLQNRSIGTAPF
jgi:hypothetical protein